MKFLKQVVAPIGLVVALVFGVTFLANYSATDRGNAQQGTESDGPGPNEVPLRFGAFAVAYKPDSDFYHNRQFPSEYEIDQPGAFDYWFRNTNPQSVRLRLMSVSCQCQSMEAAVIPVKTADRFLRQSAAASLTRSALPGAPDILGAAALLTVSLSKEDVKRSPLDPALEEGVEIPGARPDSGPQLGFVRLHWTGKSPPGPKHLGAKLSMSLPKGAGRVFDLEIDTLVLPTLRVWPTELDFLDLTEGATRIREFHCVSSTRPPEAVRMSITSQKPHPCIVVGEPELVTGPELAKLEQSLGRQWEEDVRLRSAWKVTVTVHERYQGQHMDLGPINRFVAISAGDGTEYSLPLKGVVRGEVRIAGGAEDKDYIDVGQNISSERGRLREVRLLSDRTTLELELVPGEHLPSYLDVTLNPLGVIDGKKQWKLAVRIPEKKLYGKLPPDSGFTLRTKDTPPRRIRIPVRGQTLDTSGDF